MSNAVPEKWLDYKPYGEVIKGTKMVAFKVPLKETISKSLPDDQRFTPKILRETLPKLKCIIDLTNTARYYDRKEFTDAGVQYQKIMVPGKQVPPMDSVMQFFKAMDVFTPACGEDGIVGIHCTHGVNRTGYLICRYLVQQLGWELEDSLKAFKEARGHGIEREAYVEALKEVPRGKKIDTSTITLSTNSETFKATQKLSQKAPPALKPKRPAPYPMGPPGFTGSRRGYANGGPFPPQPYGFGGPPPAPAVFRQMPPPAPGGPPPGPMYGPRPYRYGLPPMRPHLPHTPGPNFPPGPGFPPRLPGVPRIPGPPRMPGPPRLPCPPPRLLPPKMAPPPPPPPLPPRPIPRMLKRLQAGQKKKPVLQQPHHLRNGLAMAPRVPPGRLFRPDETSPVVLPGILPKVLKEQDFTVDTFEENLLASNNGQQRPLPRLANRGLLNDGK